MNIAPDYTLLAAVDNLRDGASAHAIAQEVNAYGLCIRALNEPLEPHGRADLEAMREAAERRLRAFVATKRLERLAAI